MENEIFHFDDKSKLYVLRKIRDFTFFDRNEMVCFWRKNETLT